MAMHQLMAATLDAVIDEIRAIQHEARAQRAHAAAALADDRAAHAQGLDRARRWSTACKSKAPSARTRCRSPECATNPEHLRMLEDWMQSYQPEELFDENGTLIPELRATGAEGHAAHGRQPARQRRPAAAATWHAGFPRLRGGRAERRARSKAKPRASLGDFLRDVMKLQRRSAQLPRLRPGRNRLEPPGRAVRSHRPRCSTAEDRAGRRPSLRRTAA